MSSFVLYDGRAIFSDPEDASVMDCADSETEARQSGLTLWKGYDAIWYEYDCGPGNVLTNGRARFDIPPQSEGK